MRLTGAGVPAVFLVGALSGCGTTCPAGAVRVAQPRGDRCVTPSISHFATCLRAVHLDDKSTDLLAVEHPEPDVKVAARKLSENGATPREQDLIMSCAALADEASGSRGGEVEPPQELKAEQFGAQGEIFLNVDGGLTVAMTRIHDMLAVRAWRAAETVADPEATVIAHNVPIEDDGPKHRLVSIRFRVHGEAPPATCTKIDLGWLMQVRGRRDKVWQLSDDTQPPAVFTDVVAELMKARCP